MTLWVFAWKLFLGVCVGAVVGVVVGLLLSYASGTQEWDDDPR